jgi:hypothetical protein
MPVEAGAMTADDAELVATDPRMRKMRKRRQSGFVADPLGDALEPSDAQRDEAAADADGGAAERALGEERVHAATAEAARLTALAGASASPRPSRPSLAPFSHELEGAIHQLQQALDDEINRSDALAEELARERDVRRLLAARCAALEAELCALRQSHPASPPPTPRSPAGPPVRCVVLGDGDRLACPALAAAAAEPSRAEPLSPPPSKGDELVWTAGIGAAPSSPPPPGVVRATVIPAAAAEGAAAAAGARESDLAQGGGVSAVAALLEEAGAAALDWSAAQPGASPASTRALASCVTAVLQQLVTLVSSVTECCRRDERLHAARLTHAQAQALELADGTPAAAARRAAEAETRAETACALAEIALADPLRSGLRKACARAGSEAEGEAAGVVAVAAAASEATVVPLAPATAGVAAGVAPPPAAAAALARAIGDDGAAADAAARRAARRCKRGRVSFATYDLSAFQPPNVCVLGSEAAQDGLIAQLFELHLLQLPLLRAIDEVNASASGRAGEGATCTPRVLPAAPVIACACSRPSRSRARPHSRGVRASALCDLTVSVCARVCVCVAVPRRTPASPRLAAHVLAIARIDARLLILLVRSRLALSPCPLALLLALSLSHSLALSLALALSLSRSRSRSRSLALALALALARSRIVMATRAARRGVPSVTRPVLSRI